MTERPINDPTPRARAYGPARVLGTVAIVILVLAIILLALGVFSF